MLVISRRKGQRIVIGNELEIVVTGLSRSMVRLGIAAPNHTPVFRGEVWDSISAANRDAASTALDADVASLRQAATQLLEHQCTADPPRVQEPQEQPPAPAEG